MAKPTIICEGCGEETEVNPRWASKQRFCRFCQIDRDARSRKAGQRVCVDCDKPFWPLRPGKGWNKCPDCVVFFTMEDRRNAPNCNICGIKKPPALGLEKTCLACICADEGHREVYFRKVREIVAERYAKNFHRTPSGSKSVV